MTRQQYEAEYELMASALKDVVKMFAELDDYRKTKQQQSLWRAHGKEASVRRQIKALVALQKEHDAQQKQRAA